MPECTAAITQECGRGYRLRHGCVSSNDRSAELQILCLPGLIFACGLRRRALRTPCASYSSVRGFFGLTPCSQERPMVIRTVLSALVLSALVCDSAASVSGGAAQQHLAAFVRQQPSRKGSVSDRREALIADEARAGGEGGVRRGKRGAAPARGRKHPFQSWLHRCARPPALACAACGWNDWAARAHLCVMQPNGWTWDKNLVGPRRHAAAVKTRHLTVGTSAQLCFQRRSNS